MAMMSGALARARALAGNPSALAMMMGAARASAEGRAKAVADDYASRTAKAKISIDVDGEGRKTLTAKRVPVDDVGAQIQDAYEGPHRELLSTLSDTLNDLDSQHVQRSAAGLDPEAIRKELSTHEGRVKASLELGASSRRKAEHDSLRIQNGEIPIERAIQQVLEKRSGKARELLKQVDARGEHARQITKSARSEVEKTSDLQDLTPTDVASRSGVDVSAIENDPALVDAMKRKRDELTVGKARSRFDEGEKLIRSIDSKTVSGYNGNFDAWLSEQSADLTPKQQNRARHEFAGVKTEVDRTSARFDRWASKLEAGTKEKPVLISPGDSHVMSVDDLLDLVGDERANQNSVAKSVLRKSSEVNSRLKTLEGERKSKRTMLAELRSREKPPADAERLLSLDADVTNLTEHINDLRADAAKIADYRTGASTEHRTAVSKDEWDALIEKGHTPESLKKRGIHVK